MTKKLHEIGTKNFKVEYVEKRPEILELFRLAENAGIKTACWNSLSSNVLPFVVCSAPPSRAHFLHPSDDIVLSNDAPFEIKEHKICLRDIYANKITDADK